MTKVVERELSDRVGRKSPDRGDAGSQRSPDSETTAARLRERGERIRRRELDTALRRLEARGEISPAERTILDRLSERITAAIVEQWASNLGAGGIDCESALELLES